MFRLPVPFLLLIASCRYFSSDDGYERSATLNEVGVELRDFPEPQGPKGFSDLDPADGPALRVCVANLREIADPDRAPAEGTFPAPAGDRPMSNAVARRTPRGELWEAWVNTPGHVGVAEAPWMRESRPSNTRHRYVAGTSGFFGTDVFIGPFDGKRLNPVLFFRDLGFHSSGVIDMAVGEDGLCHLLGMDVDIGQGNRLKVLYVVGDPAGHRWQEAWVLHHSSRFTSMSRCAIVLDGPRRHLAWAVDGGKPGHDEEGVFAVDFHEGRFMEKRRISPHAAHQVALARGPDGSLLLVWGEGFLKENRRIRCRLRKPDGTWTAAAVVEAPDDWVDALSLFPAGPGTFRLRTYRFKSGWRSEGLFIRVRECDLGVETP